MDMNTLWIFGDSFEYGIELTDINHPYCKKYKTEHDKHYSQHIADRFNLKIENLSMPGFGSGNILYLFSKAVKHIKKEDYVVLHTSDSRRLVGFEPVNGEHPFQMASLSAWFDEHDEKMMTQISKNFYQTFSRYLVECVDPVSGYFDEYYYRIFNNILASLNCKKVFGYTPNEWGNYETISNHTSGEINDNHWSFKGHKDFADRILREWETQDYVFKPSTLNMSFIEHQLDFPRKFTIL